MAAEEFNRAEIVLRRARLTVADHTDKMAAAAATWREETITELILAETHPVLRCADFAHDDEAVIGADWLWWWVSRDGTCFGALVQAKKLTFTSAGTPTIDWQHDGMRQYRDLMRAAEDLGVPALYAIYFGGLGYREDWPCVKMPVCEDCAQRTVTMVPAATFGDRPKPVPAARRAVQYGIAMEKLNGGKSWLTPFLLNGLAMTSELREFLTKPQTGARSVAKTLMSTLINFRNNDFGLAGPGTLTRADGVADDLVFPQVPDDRMHGGTKLYEHVLGGLRKTPPSYVLDVQHGIVPASAITEKIRGVTVLDLGR